MSGTRVDLSNPTDTEPGSDLAASVRFMCYRCGVNTTRQTGKYHEYPHAVMGQVVDGSIIIQREGRPAEIVERGGGYVVPPHTRRRSVMRSDQALTFRWAHVDFLLWNGVDLFSALDGPLALPPSDGAVIGKLNAELRGLATQTNAFSSCVTRNRIGLQLLEIVVKHARLNRDGQRLLALSAQLQPVLQWINGHLAEPVSVSRLAKLAYLSPSRFHAVFKSAIGRSPHQYVQAQRLVHARRWLSHSSDSISAIAERLGYASVFHFSKQFKKCCGVSPRAYRGQAQSAAGGLLPPDAI